MKFLKDFIPRRFQISSRTGFNKACRSSILLPPAIISCPVPSELKRAFALEYRALFALVRTPDTSRSMQKIRALRLTGVPASVIHDRQSTSCTHCGSPARFEATRSVQAQLWSNPKHNCGLRFLTYQNRNCGYPLPRRFGSIQQLPTASTAAMHM